MQHDNTQGALQRSGKNGESHGVFRQNRSATSVASADPAKSFDAAWRVSVVLKTMVVIVALVAVILAYVGTKRRIFHIQHSGHARHQSLHYEGHEQLYPYGSGSTSRKVSTT
jgi:hypothetical protein